jgi:hypothetical protein
VLEKQSSRSRKTKKYRRLSFNRKFKAKIGIFSILNRNINYFYNKTR